jgi:chemotaxis protein methyltransferase CheR
MNSQYVIEAEGFDTLCSLIYREYGVDIRATNRTIVQRKMERYCAQHGLTSLADCLRFIQCGKIHLQEVGDFVYSQNTMFNRQPADFAFLVDTLLREDRSGSASAPDPLHVVCLGCSTGQEAYTVAIHLMEYVFTSPSSRSAFHVAGLDCSQACLRIAAEGKYQTGDVRRLEPIPYAKYFVPSCDGQHIVGAELRQLVTFRQFNLITSDYTLERDIDYVFLRNAINFHTASSRASILTKVHRTLRARGYLILGEGPRIGKVDVRDYGFESVAAGYYRAV